MKRILFAGLLILSVTIAFVACQKEMSVEHGIIPGQLAKGSLKDTSGNCLPDSIHGTWYNGVAPGDTNFVEIQVNVDSIGTYVVYTNTQNGLSFRDSGSFTSTGLNTIKLKPTGVAIAHDPTLFTVYFDTSICEFTLPVMDSTGTGLGGGTDTAVNESDTAWQFTEGINGFHGSIDSARIGDSVTFKSLYLYGSTSATKDTAWVIGIAYNGDDPSGSYKSTDSTAVLAFFKKNPTSDNDLVYYTSSDPTIGDSIAVNITYNATTKIAQGTFNGRALYRGSDSVVNITDGRFKAKLP